MASYSIPPSRGQRSKIEDPVERLIEAARLELAQGGLRAMSFRRLGGAVGATAGALTYHLGAKARILEDVIAHERERDRKWHEAWRDRVAEVQVFDASGMAVLLEHYLTALVVGEARITQLIWTDLMLRAPINEKAADLMRPWLADRRAFWTRLFQGRIEEDDVWPYVVAAFVTDEGVHSLVSGEDADYRLLRRLVIGRLVQRLHPDRRGGLDAAFPDLIQRLDPHVGLPTRDDESDLISPGRRHDMAMAACRLLMEEGVDAVTHRAVSARAGASASAAAYYFRSAADLVKAGLSMVYLIAEGRSPEVSLEPEFASPEQRGIVSVRGTLAVALAAARDPSLTGYAIDLRRLRGVNYVHVLRDRGCVHIDALDGQAASMVGTGSAALSGIDGDERHRLLVDWLTQPLKICTTV